MMHGNVSRLVVASFLALTTACPLDGGEGNPSSTTNDTNDEGTTTNDSSTVSITGASATSPSTTMSSSDTMATTSSPSTTDPTTTETTDETTATTTETTMGTEESGSGSTGPIVGDPATIQEIQMGDVDEDSAVEITGAICTAVAVNGFFMQDPAGGEYSAIWVFTGDEGPFPALGDEVTVVGIYEEFFELSEINTTGGGSVEVTDSPGAGNVPAPEVLSIAAAAEEWESVFVRIEDGPYTVNELNDMMNVHEFVVENGEGTLWIDDFMYDWMDEGDFVGFDVGATFEAIQGPLNFSFDEFKIAPRTVDDLEGYSAP